jgi:uncharacterized protein (DUF305 family)
MIFTLPTIALPSALTAALVLTATLALTSCGASSDPSGHGMPGMTGTMTSTPAAGAKTAADIDFAKGMIPHHAQAVEMAGLALTKATDAKVKALATRVEAAQGPEIKQMSGWLKAWKVPIPATTGGQHLSGMPNMGGMSGMMSAKEMADLGTATGSAFDRRWLQMMVRHHQGAVAMARTAVAQQPNPESRKLAQSIIASQTAQIAELSSVLAGLPG